MARRSGEEKVRNMVSSTSYCYSDVSSSEAHLVNQLQSFDPNPVLYNLTTGMEMIGFQPKNQQQPHHQQQQQSSSNSAIWKGFVGKPPNHYHPVVPSTSKTINESDFYRHELLRKPDFTSENFLAATDSASWNENRLLVDDPSSSLRCVFPCEGNERPSQGLSLSLSSSNPSGIGLQHFELRQEDDIRLNPSSSRDGLFDKSIDIHPQQQRMMQDDFLGDAAHLQNHQGHFEIRSSKYLAPTRELLNEFCCLGTKQNDSRPKTQLYTPNQLQDDNASCASLDLLELQTRKAKLLQMLEEVDRRYRHYCDQMRAVVSSFEAVAGNQAATVYSSLASKAMSRHFRCLRDGIVGQIKVTKKAMGEKDLAAPGTSRGETPRLRILDQTLRQQKAFQQMGMVESHPWRPQRGLPDRSVCILRAWLFEHFLHPYPSDVDKIILARQTNLSRSQVSNWFINARVRLWKPMVEEMYLEEVKEQEDTGFSDGDAKHDHNTSQQNQNSQTRSEDQKPTIDQLARLNSEGLYSLTNNSGKNGEPKILHHCQRYNHQPFQHGRSFGRVSESFGEIELDFSSAQNQPVGGVSFSSENLHQSFGSGGSNNSIIGGVSLTLGLEQHGGNGVNVAFTPPSQNSLLYPKYSIVESQTVQYSLLDGEGQNLPIRNLMGSQLLHDLAG